MPRFILLNGPPGIGKSTLAQLFVDNHPGTLNLDADQLRSMIGGWRDRFAETGHLVRPIALNVAQTHLHGGQDVIMPQYLGKISEIERFETAAHHTGAEFLEIVLMDTKQRAVRRFAQRGEHDTLPWHRYVVEYVRHNGGESILAQMYDQLTEAIHARPRAEVLFTTPGAIQQSYRDLLCAVTALTAER